MAEIYQFPFTDTPVKADVVEAWKKERDEMLRQSDLEAEKIFAYMSGEVSDNPFEQMERKRLYDEFMEYLDSPGKKTSAPRIIIED